MRVAKIRWTQTPCLFPRVGVGSVCLQSKFQGRFIFGNPRSKGGRLTIVHLHNWDLEGLKRQQKDSVVAACGQELDKRVPIFSCGMSVDCAIVRSPRKEDQQKKTRVIVFVFRAYTTVLPGGDLKFGILLRSIGRVICVIWVICVNEGDRNQVGISEIAWTNLAGL